MQVPEGSRLRLYQAMAGAREDADHADAPEAADDAAAAAAAEAAGEELLRSLEEPEPPVAEGAHGPSRHHAAAAVVVAGGGGAVAGPEPDAAQALGLGADEVRALASALRGPTQVCERCGSEVPVSAVDHDTVWCPALASKGW
eukprot:TRINITY_DN27281_c0_g1_i3.p2 TRINITY_DN27281_c0_g1~~TRINITY_DN27281_c0_g1_i3.p2  ORF type:complete len:166 (+),score=39.64 TRINITY_DN27281_c0_g1_i3:72-500(+)